MWLLFAALSAIAFGMRGILYQWSSRQPISRNAMLCGVYICGMVVTLGSALVLRQSWIAGTAVGAAMGALSYVGNASMYRGYATGKASIVAVLVGMPPAVVALAAFAFWGEKLTPAQTVAFAILLAGALLVRTSNGLSLRNLQGAGWGLVAMFGFAGTDLLSKQATRLDADPLPVLAVMFATGAVLFGLSWAAERRGRRKPTQADDVLRSRAAGEAAARRWTPSRAFGWGLIVGLTNCAGMILIMPAFKYGVTGLVSAVIAVNALFVVIYARVVLKEPFRRMETIGIAGSLAGVILLQLTSG